MNSLKNATVIKVNMDFFTVLTEDDNYIECRSRGKIKGDDIITGDKVLIDEKHSMIEKVFGRENSLIRPLIANINKLIIVCSVKEPDFSLFLLDKFLVLAHLNNIEPIIVITKYDLLNMKEKKDIKKILKYYKSLGYKVFFNTQINKIKKTFNNSIIALSGQTGSGKSTLLNKIDKSLNLETNEISKALGRGKHTTRIVTLYKVGKGFVADTPGFSSLEINHDKKDIRNGFIEFERYTCKYKSCIHDKEDGCEIKKEVNKKIMKSRYESYIKILSEVK